MIAWLLHSHADVLYVWVWVYPWQQQCCVNHLFTRRHWIKLHYKQAQTTRHAIQRKSRKLFLICWIHNWLLQYLCQVVSSCYAARITPADNGGQLAAEATRRVSVGKILQSETPFTGTSYKCALCPSTFKRKNTLKNHFFLFQRFMREIDSRAHSVDVGLSVEVD